MVVLYLLKLNLLSGKDVSVVCAMMGSSTRIDATTRAVKLLAFHFFGKGSNLN